MYASRRVGAGRFAWGTAAVGAEFAAHSDAGFLQVAAGRLPSNAHRLLDVAKHPAQPAEREYLLLLVVAQDVHETWRAARTLD